MAVADFANSATATRSSYRFDARRSALVPWSAGDPVAVLAGRQLVRRDTGRARAVGAGEVETESVRQRYVARLHAVADGDRNVRRSAFGREPHSRAFRDADLRGVV